MARSLVRVLAAVVTVIVVSFVVRTAIWGGPFVLYLLRKPPIRSRCAAIRAGMTLPEVEALIHSGTWPTQESVSGNQFSFGTWETCKVDLDLTSQKVVSVQLVREPGGVE